MEKELAYTDNFFEGILVWNKIQDLNAEQILVETEGQFYTKHKSEIISKEKYDEIIAERRVEKKRILVNCLANNYISTELAEELVAEIKEEGEINEE